MVVRLEGSPAFEVALLARELVRVDLAAGVALAEDLERGVRPGLPGLPGEPAEA